MTSTSLLLYLDVAWRSMWISPLDSPSAPTGPTLICTLLVWIFVFYYHNQSMVVPTPITKKNFGGKHYKWGHSFSTVQIFSLVDPLKNTSLRGSKVHVGWCGCIARKSGSTHSNSSSNGNPLTRTWPKIRYWNTV